ncbi:hypothetical protein [Cohnella cholangitidis]|uniref:Uncharacterized protein n=1 Tax=Cohnella cholangitidis TaxID=2598458 RepID=A0A7G5C1F3_9BACL|nr:hypothetical protein [Cohnella cholangitidis]QMV43037.1 hypothetical protein FPL14_18995 [Cohnella cholangitidis]
MKKKIAMIGAGVVAGSVLLMSSVYAGIGSTPGYDTYKSAIKNTAAVENATKQVNLSVEDNGKTLFEVDSTLKSGKEDLTGSAAITLRSGGTEQGIQIYSQNGKEIIKTSGSDVYRIVESGDEEREWAKESHDRKKLHDPEFAKEAEKVIDSLVGNLKQAVTLKEEGAAKEVSLQLERSQIPAIVNAIGSLIVREGGREHGKEHQLDSEDTFGVDVQRLADALPKLTDEIKIDALRMDADVNADNVITNHAVEIRISGKDSQGIAHQVAVKLDLILSEFNRSIPDTVDLAGKKVETVKPHEMFNRGHRS